MTLLIPVGIDLGTTFSAAARITELVRTEMLANARDQLLTPSVVHFGDSQVSVGREAVDLSIAEPGRTVENAKRHVGSEHNACQVSGASLPAEAVQGFLLKQIKRDVTKCVGPNFKCVITAPAYFDEPRRQAVANSGLLSGLDVLDIVNEPTAAALAYGEQLGFLDATGTPKKPLNLMVYDLGGGTFDVTALRLAPHELVTRATDGDVELGGLNWDDRLAELLWQRYQAVKHPADPEASHDPGYWRRLANGVKHTLSDESFALVACEGPAGPVEIPVTRDEFDEATADLLERTLFTTRQTLLAAGWTWGDVDRLLLVGGSTRMPMVRAALERLAKMAPETSVHPDEAVARGAAIYAQSCLTKQGLSSVARELSVTSVSAHSLGVVGVDIATMHKEAVTIIPKNTQLPCTVKRRFVTRTKNQPSVGVEITEGESSLPEHNSKLGNAGITNLPPGLPAGTEIEVTYAYDASGRLRVTAQIPGVGKPAELSLERLKGIPDKRINQWKEIVKSDGGFKDFGEAVEFLMDSPLPPVSKEELAPAALVEAPSDKPLKKHHSSYEPAEPIGASQAASDKLKQTRRAAELKKKASPEKAPPEKAKPDAPKLPAGMSPRPRKKERNLLVSLLGHVLAAAAGLAIGYYLLCMIRPEANFLQLRLPGLTSSAPAPQEP